MVGDILVIDAGRVGDRQAAFTAPVDVDPVVARGETGDQVEGGELFDQRLVQRRLAGDDQGADVMGGLDRRAFPEAVDIIGALEDRRERGEMPLHDENGGALGHAAAPLLGSGDQRPNFWCWIRLGMMLSAPRRRILSCS